MFAEADEVPSFSSPQVMVVSCENLYGGPGILAGELWGGLGAIVQGMRKPSVQLAMKI